MTVTAETWRATGQRYIDLGYGYGFCDRCGGSCHEFDCSGLQCHISNETHITQNFCTSSFVIAQLCWDAGLFMTAEQADADNGPDVFYAVHGADEGRIDDGSKPNGASGHIVTVVRVRDANGKTVGFYTIEAMGRRYGCVNGTYFGRAWTGRYRIPGVASAPPPPPPVARPPKGIIVDFTKTRATTMDVAYKAPGYFESSWNTGVNLAQCFATLHGPKYDTDGPWPWLLGASVRVQVRNDQRVLVSVTAPNWKDGNPLPMAHVFGIPK